MPMIQLTYTRRRGDKSKCTVKGASITDEMRAAAEALLTAMDKAFVKDPAEDAGSEGKDAPEESAEAPSE